MILSKNIALILMDKCFSMSLKMVKRSIKKLYFSETFAVIAFAAYAKASGSQEAAEQARAIFGKCIEYASGEIKLAPKFTDTRPSKGIGTPMIMINTAQQLRDTIGDPRCDEAISTWIKEIETNFVERDLKVVMEQVSPKGEIIDHIDGRTFKSRPCHRRSLVYSA